MSSPLIFLGQAASVLTQARADGSYHNRLMQLAKIRVLVIDDWGLESLKPVHRNDLMEIMDDRLRANVHAGDQSIAH